MKTLDFRIFGSKTTSFGAKNFPFCNVVKIVPIDLDMEERTPLASRNAPAFKSYFTLIWKELNQNA